MKNSSRSHKQVTLIVAGLNPLEVLGLTAACEMSEIELLAVAAGGPELRDLVLELNPDVVLAEANLAGRSVFDACGEIRKRVSTVWALQDRTISDTHIAQALRLGFRGIMTKAECPGFVVSGLRRLADGERVYSRSIHDRIRAATDSGEKQPQFKERAAQLGDRAIEVWRLISAGHSTKTAAAELDLSNKSVGSHRYRLSQVLGTSNAVELLWEGIRAGVISPPTDPASAAERPCETWCECGEPHAVSLESFSFSGHRDVTCRCGECGDIWEAGRDEIRRAEVQQPHWLKQQSQQQDGHTTGVNNPLGVLNFQYRDQPGA